MRNRVFWIISLTGRLLAGTVKEKPNYFVIHSSTKPIFSLSSSLIVRNYAKSKNKGGGKKKPAQIEVCDEEISEFISIEKMYINFQRPVNKMRDDFINHLTLRSAIGSVDALRVKHEGREYQLQKIAQIVKINPTTVLLDLSSFPQTIPSVLKAIEGSGMNLNPQQDGNTLLIPIPIITKDHREILAKNAMTFYMDCRARIKRIHREFIKIVKDKEDASDDLAFSVIRQLHILKGKYLDEAATLYVAKKKELTRE